MRYLLLDRIDVLEPPIATGVKCVSLSEDVFGEHFPGHAIFPGALILESMAQLGGVLLEECKRKETGADGLHAVLSMADRVRFRKPVRPGDKLELTATLRTVNDDGGQVDVSVLVDGQPVAEARLGFAFAQVSDPRLLQTRADVLSMWRTGSIAGPV